MSKILTGFLNLMLGRKTPQDERRARICSGCKFLRANKTCSVCNCYMPAKVKSPKAKCPKNKW